MLADLKERGLLDRYPLTDTGKLSLAKDDLKDTFGKQTGTFGGDFRVLMNKITCYNGILADGKSDWLSAYDENDGLMRSPLTGIPLWDMAVNAFRDSISSSMRLATGVVLSPR